MFLTFVTHIPPPTIATFDWQGGGSPVDTNLSGIAVDILFPDMPRLPLSIPADPVGYVVQVRDPDDMVSIGSAIARYGRKCSMHVD